MDRDQSRFVAIGRRLEGIPEVLTLGVKPNYLDYTPRERQLMETAGLILYPTQNFAQFFTTMGKKIFPSLETHLYADEKIMQTTLFYMLGIPHPRTRFYYRRHHGDILKEFIFPFVAKLPRASAQGRGVYLINDSNDLEQYLHLSPVAYIQEYLPHDRDLRVILIDYKPILAYWRESPPGDFRTNVFQGGTIHFEDIPHEVIEMAQEIARKCHFDDVGLDFIQGRGKWFLIEANMKYGRKALKKRGMDLKTIIRDQVLTLSH
jgi:ribosomal protein S6--L-glutamate ligase